MTPGSLNFTLYRGANFGPLTLYLQDANGAAVNIVGQTPNAWARPLGGCSPTINLAPTLGNGANGEIVISRNSEATLNDACGAHEWDLLLTNSSGYVLGPIVKGRIQIVPLITVSA